MASAKLAAQLQVAADAAVTGPAAEAAWLTAAKMLIGFGTRNGPRS